MERTGRVWTKGFSYVASRFHFISGALDWLVPRLEFLLAASEYTMIKLCKVLFCNYSSSGRFCILIHTQLHSYFQLAEGDICFVAITGTTRETEQDVASGSLEATG